MIEGISYFEKYPITACLLISMSKGEFSAGWNGGQTKEDIILARSIGIKSIIILMNKMDSIDWNKDEYNTVKNTVNTFINSCKFDKVIFIPVSGFLGTGLINKDGMPEWYDGPYFLEAINSINNEKEKFDIIEKETWNNMLADVKILSYKSIICPGFSCMMHYGGKEYEVEFIKMKTNKFLKERSSDKVLITSKVPIQNKQSVRFILRTSDNTIGYGVILKVK